MKPKMYNNFYDCMYDVQTVLGISDLKDLDIGIKFAIESGFPDVANYFRANRDRLNYHVRREFEEDHGIFTNADIISGT